MVLVDNLYENLNKGEDDSIDGLATRNENIISLSKNVGKLNLKCIDSSNLKHCSVMKFNVNFQEQK